MDNGASSYRRFLDGDDEGLADIVREYSDGLTLFLHGIVGDIDLAEELMQETLFRLITKKPRFIAKYSFKTWLFTIGRNVAIDHIRRQSRLSDVNVAAVEDADGALDGVERIYLLEERKIALHKALQNLSSDYRQTLWLVYFEEMSLREAASVMKKSSRQMKNLMYRAKNALRAIMNQEGFVYEDL